MRWEPILLILLAAAPAAAQDAPAGQPGTQDEDALAAERLMMLPPRPPKPRCKENGEEGAIVVCGRTTETERYRVKSSGDEDPLSAGATRTGVPHVGQSLVTGLRDCSPASGNKCRSLGRAPAPIYYFDITKLPPPPEGSDADKIAKDEMAAP
ncbi:MAG: hypothetical protein KGN34_17300 [Sphingomonadales bacterium]|nr:hypothetical protein [Sphingomonadales bacterium]